MSRAKSRRNGWSLPPHGLQVAAWLVTIWVAIVAFGAIVPNFTKLYFRIAFNLVTGLLIAVMILLNIVVTSLDPADLNVKLKVRKEPRPLFDKDRHVHVIDENFFCNICEAFINASSKHCRQCNKCVAEFDHHCKWLNNCVGRRNYYWFIAYVVATVLAAVWMLVLSVVQPVLWALQNPQVTTVFIVFGSTMPEYGWLILVLSTAVVMLLVSALTVHLLAFHIRLISNGMTTYGYIMEEKQKEEEKHHSRTELEKGPHRRWLCFNGCIRDHERDSVVIDSTSTSISLSASVNNGALRQQTALLEANGLPKPNVWTTSTNISLAVPSNIDKTPPSTAGRQVIGRRLSLSRRVNRTFSKFIANASSSYARMSGTRGDGEPNKLSQHPQVDIEDANDANSTNHLIKQSAVPKLPSIHSNGVGNEDSRLSQITLPGGKRKTTLPGIFMSSSSMDDQICEIPIDTFRVKEKSRKADSLSNSKSSQLDLFQRRQNASNGLCKASGRFALVRCEKSSLDLTPLNDGIVAQTVLSRQEQPRNSLG